MMIGNTCPFWGGVPLALPLPVFQGFAVQVSAVCDALSPGFGGPWAGQGGRSGEGPFVQAVVPFVRLQELIAEE